jgi:hypothetical protein
MATAKKAAAAKRAWSVKIWSTAKKAPAKKAVPAKKASAKKAVRHEPGAKKGYSMSSYERCKVHGVRYPRGESCPKC